MFSYKLKKRNNRSANIKRYLGGLQGLNVDADEIDDSSDSQSMGTGIDTCSTPNLQSQVSILLEIPEELDAARSPSRYEDDASRLASTTKKQNQKLKDHARRSDNSRCDSAAVVEIGSNLMDLDNYMLSAFHMNDDTSVFTKATADTGFSSSNSTSSILSTRNRHRGAFRNRRDTVRFHDSLKRRDTIHRNKKAHNWLDSMKKSSMDIFQDGGDGWTPSRGWCIVDEKSGWNTNTDRHWNDRDPIFDVVQMERLEI